jgi:hypothetical protein
MSYKKTIGKKKKIPNSNKQTSLRNFASLCVLAVKIGKLLSHRKDAKDRGDTQRWMYIKYCNSSVIVFSKTCCLTKINHLGHSATLLFPTYYCGLN